MKIERLDVSKREVYENRAWLIAHDCVDKINELIDTVNKLTEDKGEKCPECKGDGDDPNTMFKKRCPTCNGSGVKGDEERYNVCQHVTCKMLTNGDKFCDEHKPKPKSPLVPEFSTYGRAGESVRKPKSLEEIIEKSANCDCKECIEKRKDLASAIRSFIKENAPEEDANYEVSEYYSGRNAYRKELLEAMGIK